jgi:hypothetical protein
MALRASLRRRKLFPELEQVFLSGQDVMKVFFSFNALAGIRFSGKPAGARGREVWTRNKRATSDVRDRHDGCSRRGARVPLTDAASKRTSRYAPSGAGASSGVAVGIASGNSGQRLSWPAFPYLTNEMRRNAELSRVVRMNHWVKFVGLVLIAAVLVIVVAPELDLPPMARFSSLTHGVPLAAFNSILPVSIIISLQPNFLSSLARVRLPSFNDFPPSLIDLNCTRLC